MAEQRSWTLDVIQNPDCPDDWVLDLSGFSEHLGWHPGDTLEWNENSDGSWTIKKKQ